MSGVIDLITPPPSPKRHNEENHLPQHHSHGLAAKRKVREESSHAADADCLIVQPPRRPLLQPAAVVNASAGGNGSSTNGSAMGGFGGVSAASGCGSSSSAEGGSGAGRGDGDDVQFVGRAGHIALSDFPHSRHNCLNVKFTQGEEHNACPHCFCYVCDLPTAQCSQWATHCKAFVDDPPRGDGFWSRQREKTRMERRRGVCNAGGGASLSASTSTANTNTNVIAGAQSRANSNGTSTTTTATTGSASLDGANDLAAARLRSIRYLESLGYKLKWNCEQLMEAVQQVYPVEEPEPRGLLPSVRLKPYQRQSLAFMLGVERSIDPTVAGRNGERGGWLCDEVGMGKTMVALALVLANPPPPSLGHRERLTVVVVPNSLVGQWADELRRFAPGLKTGVHYGSKKEPVPKVLDVLITSPHTRWPEWTRGRVHRLIVDEVHTYNVSPNISTSFTISNHFTPSFVWLLTGTPLTSSIGELRMACYNFLRSPPSLSQLLDDAEKAITEVTADGLRKWMIRHTKAQRIGGEEALALPPADCSTIWLQMSSKEKKLHARAFHMDGHKLRNLHRKGGGAPFAVDRALSRQRQMCANTYAQRPNANVQDASYFLDNEVRRMLREVEGNTKLQAFRDDLRALRLAEPSAHAVVFTHHMEAHKRLKSVSVAEGFRVFEISGTMDGESRHRQIRDFQESGASGRGPPAVFVVTVKTGAVGITLTAATRVYLFEPALDPAAEVQMAGRIHRLGQTKDVLIKRFCFRGTIEERINELHQEMRAGRISVSNGELPAAAINKLLLPHHFDLELKREGKRLRTEALRDAVLPRIKNSNHLPTSSLPAAAMRADAQ